MKRNHICSQLYLFTARASFKACRDNEHQKRERKGSNGRVDTLAHRHKRENQGASLVS